MAKDRFCTPSPRRRTGTGAVVSAAGFVLALALFLGALASVSRAAQTQQMQSLEQAVRRSAVHCYATEGTYPDSLAYLQQHYGLQYDAETYRVDYEIFASNLMPVITVTAR